MRKNTAVVYWLVPAEPERELFRKLIAILAQQFDGPRFEPHLTLLRAQDAKHAVAKLRQIKAGRVRLEVRDVTYSSKFTKTLFVRLKSNAVLERLVVQLGGRKNSLRDPHISLLYKRISPRIKRELATTILLHFREVTFNAIQVVRCPFPTRTRADVESWRIITTRRLRG